jgi:2-desacetyl-2-hydroxyethyl bacteriochlorophyllide A dehydrogenase
MKALVLTHDHELRLTDRPIPPLTCPTDVLVRIRQSGVCGTDRSVLVGKFSAVPGTIMGHEAVGEVAEVGPEVTALQPEDRVVINPTLYCGSCAACLRGMLDRCLRKAGSEVGIDRDGTYAEYLVLAERFLHKIPDEMSDDRAVVIEPLACVLNNLDAAKLMPGEPVMIMGGGPIGLLCALVAAHIGSQVTVVERDPYRRRFAAGLMEIPCAAELTIIGTDQLDGVGPQPTIIDAVGNLLSTALNRIAPGGTVVVMGYDSHAEASVRPLDILQHGITIVGAGDYNSHIFPRAVDMARCLPLERLITHRFPLDRHADAFAVLAGGSRDYAAQKVLIESRAGDAGEA